MFERIDYYAGDPILGLMEKYTADNNPKKVNLGIGIIMMKMVYCPYLTV